MSCCCSMAGTAACRTCNMYRQVFDYSYTNHWQPEPEKVDYDKLADMIAKRILDTPIGK